jgi:histidyl-tRNA synthetase
LSKEAKTNRLKARLPRGLSDRGPAEIAATRRMIETIRAVYERYGFEPVETPAIEYTDALGKFLPDQDRPNEGVFSFQDDDQQWLSLRYDLTAPLARYVAENFDQLPKPYRSYRFGWVFRNEKPGPGRFRQFMQFDADTVGSSSPAADAEICMMAADAMEALGIKRGDYVVKINNRKILDGVLDAVDLHGDQNNEPRLTVLRAIDKLDRVGIEGVRELLGKGRNDESGDFTRGAQLDWQKIDFIGDVLFNILPTGQWWRQPVLEGPRRPYDDMLTREDGRFYDNYRFCDSLSEGFALGSIGRQGVEELREISQLVEAGGYGTRRIRVDTSVVRGLEYYTGPVYEVELTFETKGDDGRPLRFGSVGGGGRYDGLVGRFRNDRVPATGFSFGVSRLMAALIHLGKVDTKGEPGPVVVTVFEKERLADYQRMAQRLRDAGIRAELYLGSGKMGPQLKYADKRGAPCVVIQGGDEKAKGEVQIKDLIEGAKAAAAIASNQEWRETRPAQFAVKEEKMVEAVREVLARRDMASLRGSQAPNVRPVDRRPTLTFNEGKACDAVVRRLEKRAGVTRTDVQFPEQENHPSPVESIFKIGEQLFALEHTGIEPFEGHVQMEAQADNLYAPILNALKDALGTTARYELVIPINAFQGMKMPAVRAIQKAIIEWVKTTAPKVPRLASDRYEGTSVGPATVEGVPFSLSLRRFEPPPIPGRYFQIRHEVSNGEQLRTERIKAAVDKKFPKLAAWKRDKNAKTILVFEQNDIQLSAPDLVADAYVPLAKAREDRPDETYLVVTCMTPWHVCPILIGDKSYLELVRSDDAEYEEVDPNTLTSLTKR